MAFTIRVALLFVLLGQNQVFGAQLYGEPLPVGTAEWSYHGLTGPEYWCTLDKSFKKCCKTNKRQSPIEIHVVSTKYPAYHINYENYEILPKSMNLQNTGETLRISYTSDKNPSLSFDQNNGQKKFVLDHIHFHWGSKSDEGSEHTVNKKRFPMEMHLVHKEPEYTTLFRASEMPEAIAVVAAFFQISPKNNAKLDPFITHLKEAKYKDDTATIQPFKISDLSPGTDNFFSYNGSLTTPPCSDNVRWIVLKNAVPISEYQMGEFRLLQSKPKAEDPNNNSPLVDNHRPLQERNGRPVYRSQVAENEIIFPPN